MSDNLEARVNELEATVDALTDEMVDLKERVNELEREKTSGSSNVDRKEVGVSVDEDDGGDDDIFVA